MKNNIGLLIAICFSMLHAAAQIKPFKPTEVDILIRALVQEDSPGISAMATQEQQEIYNLQRGMASLATSQVITKDSRFRMASVSKHITAAAIYKLVQAQKLSLQDSIGRWFPSLPKQLQAIRVAQLLNHSSGILDYEVLLPAEQSQQVLDADILPFLAAKDSLYFEAGSKFRYSNTGYCLLALIVEQVAAQNYAAFVHAQLFKPLGLDKALIYEDAAEIDARAFGYHPNQGSFSFADQSLTSATKGDGGVYFSTNDFHAWAYPLMQQLQEPPLRKLFLANAMPVNKQVQYSMGLFFYQDDQGNLYCFHSGESTGFNNIVYMDISRKIVLSVFANRDDACIAKPFEAILLRVDKQRIKPTKVKTELFNWLSTVYANNY